MKTTNAERTVCKCGVTLVSWVERRGDAAARLSREFMPVTIAVQLRPDTKTTYVVQPEMESLVKRIRSVDSGKLNYHVDVPLNDYHAASKIVAADTRIESWHTEESAPVCLSHNIRPCYSVAPA